MKITLLLLCVLLLIACGDSSNSPMDEWVGIWHEAELEEKTGKIISVYSGGKFLIFHNDGTWMRSDGNRQGIYQVFGNRFAITRTGRSGKDEGIWSRTGDVLSLIHDNGGHTLFKKGKGLVTRPPRPPEPLEEEGSPVLPSATNAFISPAAGSRVAPNASLTITLDEAVDAVTVNGAAATGSGKTWTFNLAGLNLPAGRTTLNIGWTNKDGTAGSATVALIIQAEADTTAPAIDNSSVSNNDKDVDPAGLNMDGISITFSEDVKEGDISISIEGGDVLNWLAEWSANSVTIVPAKGAELRGETNYEIKISTEDRSGNKLDEKISFTT